MATQKPIAAITGAARGIGYACAELLAPHYDVAIMDIKGAEETAQKIGRGARALTLNITDEASCKSAAQAIKERGGADVLIHCAGIFAGFGVPLAEMDPATFKKQMNVNTDGTFLVMHAFIPVLKDSARVVLFSSRVGRTGTNRMSIAEPTNGHYCASKAAVNSMVKSYALELAPRGIRVNGVAPGPVATEMAHGSAGIVEYVPLGRKATPEEIAKCVRFLISDDSSFVTGHILDVNGGMSMF